MVPTKNPLCCLFLYQINSNQVQLQLGLTVIPTLGRACDVRILDKYKFYIFFYNNKLGMKYEFGSVCMN